MVRWVWLFWGILEHGAANENEPTYEAIPPMPSAEELTVRALDGAEVAQGAASERNAAESAAIAAQARTRTAKAEAEAAEANVTAHKFLTRAKHLAYEAQADQERANRAARATRDLVGGLDQVAKAAADQAVAEVTAETLAKLKKEVTETIDQYNEEQEANFKAAGKAALEAATPFQQAKWRSEKNAVEYVLRARELAQAVTALKNEAVRIAADANTYQSQGNVVIAQQRMMQAHDLMDKAIQMQGQAEGFQKTAQTINGNMGLYDLAANGAASFSAHRANPAGQGPPLPPPPAPL